MERCTGDISNPLTTAMRLSTYNDIATRLLDDKLLLTALEFYAELCETGTDLAVLKDYFGNPNNLENHIVKPEPCLSIARSSSQATLDSLDMTRYSEDGGGTDERVAILEFELRKAKENISALRANLTVITESESAIPDEISDKIQLCDSPIKPHEQRALNFLVNEYLMVQSYKLTSITFSDENENQDFEDWEDVGLNIPKPSNLLQIYREFYRKNDQSKTSTVDASVQVNPDELFLYDNNEIPTEINVDLNDTTLDENLGSLKSEMICSEQQTSESEHCLSAVDLEQCVTAENQTEISEINRTSSTATPDKFEVQSSYQDTSSPNNVTHEEKDSKSAVLSVDDTDETSSADKESSSTDICNSHVPNSSETFTQQVLAHPLINMSVNEEDDDKIHDANNNNNNEDDADDDDCDGNDDDYYHNDEDPMNCSIDIDDRLQESLRNVIAKVLPKIVPYIAHNKRDHVIPLIMNSIRVNSDTVQRDQLLRLLFNLKKKPQEAEREILLKALVSLVKVKNSAIEPEGIISLCWEQCQHKYRERRLLAVECCTALAPYTSSAVKNSLMISMLQQILLEDKEPFVRAAVVRTLALLVALNDDPSKYFQCEELALAAVDDESSEVFDIAHGILIPTLAQWALSLKRLLSHLFMRIVSKLKDLLKPEKNLHCSGNDHRSSERIIRLIKVLKILLPHMIACIANNPIVRCRVRDETPQELPDKLVQLSRSNITNPLVFANDNENIVRIINTFLENDWENVTWPELEWLTDKLFPDIMTMVKLLNTSQEVVLTCLLSYIESLCNGLGRYIVQSGIVKVFVPEIGELERKLCLHNHTSISSNIDLALIPAYTIILSTVNVIELSNALNHFIVLISDSGADINCLIITFKVLSKRRDIIEHIVGVLWDGVVNQKANVRSTTARLFGNIIENVPEQMVTSRIAPAIITLASDSDLSVKATAVEALGKLIKYCPAKEAKDKGLLTLESIVMEIDGASMTENLCIPLISTLTSIMSDCPQHFIEDVVAIHLCKLCALGLQESRRVELTIALLDAYSILVYCSLNNQCITNTLLPGLRYLQTLVNHQLPHRNENISSLIREAETRIYTMKPIERAIGPNSGLSLSITASNVGQGVEDMRQRMTKIFTPKSHSPSMGNIFRKNRN